MNMQELTRAFLLQRGGGGGGGGGRAGGVGEMRVGLG